VSIIAQRATWEAIILYRLRYTKKESNTSIMQLTDKKFSYEIKTGLFILAVFILRIIVIHTSGIELHSDEAYYFLWSKRLGWSYYDHPPMIAYLIALSNLIFSNMEVAVKIIPNLLFSGTSVYIFLLGRELFDKKTAFYSVVLINFLPVFVWNSIYASPDIAMIFFLSGASYYFYLATKRENIKHWLLAGIFTGAALLSKYLAVLIYPSFFCYLLLSENRKCFRRIIVYLSFLLSILIFLPVILWNYSNGWISFKYQFGRGFEEGVFPNWQTFGDFWGSQAMIINPILFIIFILIAVYLILKWKKCLSEEKYLWFLSAVPFFFFLIVSLQKRVKVNWPAYIYLPGILLVFLFYTRVLKHKKYFKIIWIANWIYSFLLFVLFLMLIHSSLIPAKVVRFYEYFGWKQLGKEISLLVKQNPKFILAAKRYDFASEIEAYSNKKVICIGNPKHFKLWGKSQKSFTGFQPYFYCVNGSIQSVYGNNFSEDLFKVIPLKCGDKTIREVSIYKVFPVPFYDVLQEILANKKIKKPLIASNIRAVYNERNFININKVFNYSHPQHLQKALETLNEKHSVFVLIKDPNDKFNNIIKELNFENKLNIIASQKDKDNITYRLYCYKG
jgi:4-amino-4-deoxy-L-arabinose transferase-like glycosyltransferase